MKKNKITVLEGTGSIVAKGITKLVRTDGSEEMIHSKNIIIATGARARQIPPYPIDGKNIITYRKALELRDLPKKMLVVGSGAIGSEFSYFFNTLGVEVHLVEMLPQILPVEDTEMAAMVQSSFKKQGINIYTETTAAVEVVSDGEITVTLTDKKRQTKIFDCQSRFVCSRNGS
jgi:dihydrolipoamide dehydrogenase